MKTVPSFFLFIFVCYGFVELKFNINLYTLVTKYTVILIFTFHLYSVAHNVTLRTSIEIMYDVKSIITF